MKAFKLPRKEKDDVNIKVIMTLRCQRDVDINCHCAKILIADYLNL